MPLTVEQLRKGLAGAANVIQRDVENKQQFTKAPQKPQTRELYNNNGYNTSGVEYVNSDTELSYESPYGVNESYEDNGLEMPEDVQSIARNSRMPEAIKQSMLQEQIDMSALQPEGRSVLDSLGMRGVQKRGRGPQVNETYNSGIDYNLIKQIINECLDERLGGGSLKTIQVGDGKIRLVDNQGRIFVANLEYKGNVSDKKKK